MELEPYIETWTGIKFYFLNPTEDMIDIKDIAHSLSMQCRFTGHTDQFLSVAEHCVAVSCIVEKQNELAGLLHDASEAYLSDIASPIKKCFPQYYEMENKVMEVIAKKFGFTWPLEEDVRDADAIQLKTEAKYLLPSRGKDWAHLFPTSERKGKVPNCLAPIHAEHLFLRTFEEITGTRIYEEKPKLIVGV